MTRIRRPPQKQQRLTLVAVIFGISGILLLTIYLFQLDAFPKRKGNRNVGGIVPARRAPAITPEKLLAQEFIRKRDVGGGGGQNSGEEEEEEEEEEEQEGEQGEVENEGEEEQDEEKSDSGETENEKDSEHELAAPEEPLTSRKFELVVSNLKGGESGTIVIVTRPDWAPIGVRHFHKLMDARFYEGCRFFRVLPNFVAQIGIHGDPVVQEKWKKTVLVDDPVVQTNKRFTLTYATSGKNTRTTQMFFNLRDNKYLDGQGFAPFAEIVSGHEFVSQINEEYRETPDQGKIQTRGNPYLKEDFPNLSFVSSTKDVTDPMKSMQ